MSTVEIVDELDLDAPQPSPAAEAQPTPSTPAPGSILARLQAERDAKRQGRTKRLWVGTSETIAARYRPLTDDEQTAIGKRIERAQALARRTGRSDEFEQRTAIEVASLWLVTACVELLAVDAETGTARSLVEALKAENVDTVGDDPFVYDRRTARVLGLDLPADASSVDVAAALHEDNGSHSSLIAVLDQYQQWIAGTDRGDLDEVLEGN